MVDPCAFGFVAILQRSSVYSKLVISKDTYSSYGNGFDGKIPRTNKTKDHCDLE